MIFPWYVWSFFQFLYLSCNSAMLYECNFFRCRMSCKSKNCINDSIKWNCCFILPVRYGTFEKDHLTFLVHKKCVITYFKVVLFLSTTFYIINECDGAREWVREVHWNIMTYMKTLIVITFDLDVRDLLMQTDTFWKPYPNQTTYSFFKYYLCIDTPSLQFYYTPCITLLKGATTLQCCTQSLFLTFLTTTQHFQKNKYVTL